MAGIVFNMMTECAARERCEEKNVIVISFTCPSVARITFHMAQVLAGSQHGNGLPNRCVTADLWQCTSGEGRDEKEQQQQQQHRDGRKTIVYGRLNTSGSIATTRRMRYVNHGKQRDNFNL